MYFISNIWLFTIDWSQHGQFFFLLLKLILHVVFLWDILKPLEIWYNCYWIIQNRFLKLFDIECLRSHLVNVCWTGNVLHNSWTETWYKNRIGTAFPYCRWKRDLMAGCLCRGLGNSEFGIEEQRLCIGGSMRSNRLVRLMERLDLLRIICFMFCHFTVKPKNSSIYW